MPIHVFSIGLWPHFQVSHIYSPGYNFSPGSTFSPGSNLILRYDFGLYEWAKCIGAQSTAVKPSILFVFIQPLPHTASPSLLFCHWDLPSNEAIATAVYVCCIAVLPSTGCHWYLQNKGDIWYCHKCECSKTAGNRLVLKKYTADLSWIHVLPLHSHVQ